jgi:uncharacterized protein (TIGR03067 family)
MKKLIVIGIVVGAAVIAFFAARAYLDSDGITGDWLIVSLETNGKDVTQAGESTVLSFSKSTVTWKVTVGERQLAGEGEYRIVPGKEPMEIDIPIIYWKMVAEGIYRFEGDFLIICVNPASRPKQFSSNGKNLVMKLKRL